MNPAFATTNELPPPPQRNLTAALPAIPQPTRLSTAALPDFDEVYDNVGDEPAASVSAGAVGSSSMLAGVPSVANEDDSPLYDSAADMSADQAEGYLKVAGVQSGMVLNRYNDDGDDLYDAIA